MISKVMQEMLASQSVIRQMFEEGNRLKKIYGAENVFDFSLGNPNLEPPKKVDKVFASLVKEDRQPLLHGYMSNAGFEDVRGAIADNININFGQKLTAKNIIMTVGAAGGLNVILKSILNPQDEVVVFAPYFGEYRNYINNYGGKIVEVPANIPSFIPDLNVVEECLNEHTKAIIINSPNNPTGIIYPLDWIEKLAQLLNKVNKKYGICVYLIADEPYRELVFDNTQVPYIPSIYSNTIVGYSYSKSLSLAGERIGYISVGDECNDSQLLIQAMTVATRILGFVNAPAIVQKMIAQCLDECVDIDFYKTNGEMLYNAFISNGFECVKPQGAFYLWLKSPYEDEKIFCQKAKELNMLFVPGSAFGCGGYVRIAFCTSRQTIEGAVQLIPQLKKLL